MGKTQWNLTKMGFSLVTKTGNKITEFGEIHVQLGAITAAITPSDSNSNRQAADGGEFFNGSGASTFTIELTCAQFDRWFKTNLLGYFEDGEGLGLGKGVLKDATFLAEASEDQGGKRFLFYDCTSSQISVTYQTNDVDGNYTFAEESVTLTAKCVELPSGQERTGFECETGQAEYADFWNAVYYVGKTTTTPTNP